MVLKHEVKFMNLFGTLHCKLSDSKTAVYVPILRLVDTILRYRFHLWYAQNANCINFSSYAAGGQISSPACKTYFESVKSARISLSTRATQVNNTCHGERSLQNLGIDVADPIPITNSHARMKKYIIPTIYYFKQYKVAQAVVHHTSNVI